MRIAGYAPAQRQGSALHPVLDTRHLVPWIQQASKAVIGRAEVQSKFASGGRGHDLAARLRFLGRICQATGRCAGSAAPELSVSREIA